MWLKADCNVLSNICSASWSTDGEHHRRCKTLGVLKEARRRANAPWEEISLSFSFALDNSAQRSAQAPSKAAPGSRGAPRRAESSTATNENFWRSVSEVTVSGEASTSHLAVLRCRPSCWPPSMVWLTSAATDCWAPPSVKSSKKPSVSADSRESNNDWIVLQKSKGPKGSPCWGPSWDSMICGPKNSRDGWWIGRVANMKQLRKMISDGQQHVPSVIIIIIIIIVIITGLVTSQRFYF